MVKFVIIKHILILNTLHIFSLIQYFVLHYRVIRYYYSLNQVNIHINIYFYYDKKNMIRISSVLFYFNSILKRREHERFYRLSCNTNQKRKVLHIGYVVIQAILFVLLSRIPSRSLYTDKKFGGPLLKYSMCAIYTQLSSVNTHRSFFPTASKTRIFRVPNAPNSAFSFSCGRSIIGV